GTTPVAATRRHTDRFPSEVSSPIHGACLTCMVTHGSGSRTAGRRQRQTFRPTDRRLCGPEIAKWALFVAAALPRARVACDPPFVRRYQPPGTIITTGFASPCL